jgi:hypothetical protein
MVKRSLSNLYDTVTGNDGIYMCIICIMLNVMSICIVFLKQGFSDEHTKYHNCIL